MPRIEQTEGNLYQFKSPARAVAVKVATAESFFQRGLIAEERGDRDTALNLYRRAVDYNPLAACAWLNLGTIWFSRRNLVVAEGFYRKAIETDPNYAMAHYNLGNLLDEKGHDREALDCYLEAIRISPNYADPHFNLGVLYTKLAKPRKAVEHYRLYLRCPRHGSLYYQEAAQREIKRMQGQDLVIVSKPAASDTANVKSSSSVG